MADKYPAEASQIPVDQQALLGQQQQSYGQPIYNSPPPAHHHHHHEVPAAYPGAPQQTYQQGPGPQVVMINKKWTEIPENHVCQWCGVQGVTTTEYTPGMATYASAGLCCFVGLWAGCCLIPFFVDQCKDVEHHCPSCHQLVGKHYVL